MPGGDAKQPQSAAMGGQEAAHGSTPVRFRLRFEKRGALKFISHHDLMRTFELALRRAGIDVAHSRGFNPRPKLSFAMALPLGVESLDEIVDIDLAAPIEPRELVSRLQAEMPGGTTLRECWLARGRPRVTACDFLISLELDAESLAALKARLDEFMAGGATMHTRLKGPGKRARVLDARAHTLEATLDASTLRVRIAFGPQGGMKATDLLEVLGLDPLAQRIVKTGTIFEEDAHQPVHAHGRATAPNKELENEGA